MTTPNGVPITLCAECRREHPQGKRHCVNYGPWEPVETLTDLGGNSDAAHPQQPDLFGGES